MFPPRALFLFAKDRRSVKTYIYKMIKANQIVYNVTDRSIFDIKDEPAICRFYIAWAANLTALAS